MNFEGFIPPSRDYVTKFAPHKALEIIARGNLIDERVVLYRVEGSGFGVGDRGSRFALFREVAGSQDSGVGLDCSEFRRSGSRVQGFGLGVGGGRVQDFRVSGFRV